MEFEREHICGQRDDYRESNPFERVRFDVPERGRSKCTTQGCWDATPLALTPTEFRLLAALARWPGRVYGRLDLLEQLQDEAYTGYERTIDAHVKNLRKKVADRQLEQ